MIMRRTLITISLLMIAAHSLAQEKAVSCGFRYQTFATAPDSVDLYWRDINNVQYRDFATLQASLVSEGKAVKFMMNAGIFEPDGIPTGLLIIAGKTLRFINTQEGAGNFYLKPNGVFWADSSGAYIASTEEYLALNPSPRIAVQSGPLLLHKGQINAVFDKKSANRLHRNGVGIRKDGSVLFAITDFDQSRQPNLHEFATLFLDQGCLDALFLDGDLSQMVVDVVESLPPSNCFGAIFAVTEKTDQAQQ